MDQAYYTAAMKNNLKSNLERGFSQYYYMFWRSDEFENIDNLLTMTNPKFDLNNFPCPNTYFNLDIFGKTEEEFKSTWKKLYNQDIIKFESY
jgi:hypothetical protein